MKSTRINFITAVICLSLALSAALPVNARGCVPDEVERPWENEEDISYIVDFLDWTMTGIFWIRRSVRMDRAWKILLFRSGRKMRNTPTVLPDGSQNFVKW